MSTTSAASHFRTRAQVKEFADLLEQIFIVDPAKRITAAEALKHPFLH
jgi:serine/threonine protein kinase